MSRVPKNDYIPGVLYVHLFQVKVQIFVRAYGFNCVFRSFNLLKAMIRQVQVRVVVLDGASVSAAEQENEANLCRAIAHHKHGDSLKVT